jgi:hypothetical protein
MLLIILAGIVFIRSATWAITPFRSSRSRFVHACGNKIVDSVYIKGLSPAAPVAPCNRFEIAHSIPFESRRKALFKGSPVADASEFKLSTMSCSLFLLLFSHTLLFPSPSLNTTDAQLRGRLGREGQHFVQFVRLSSHTR